MATSLTAELDDIINGLETDTEKLNCMPFASQLLTMDLSEFLSMSVRSSMRLLLRYGSWFLDDTGPTKKVASANQQLCTKALLSFIMDLGTIISNAAFLFCARKGIPFADEQCCQVIKDCIDRAIASFGSSTVVGTKRKGPKSTNEKYQKEAIFRFLLSLNTCFSRALQIDLSKRCDLTKQVMLVLG